MRTEGEIQLGVISIQVNVYPVSTCNITEWSSVANVNERAENGDTPLDVPLIICRAFVYVDFGSPNTTQSTQDMLQ